MLATGGSAIKAVEVLMEHGVPEERIIFINLVCSSELLPKPSFSSPSDLLTGRTQDFRRDLSQG